MSVRTTSAAACAVLLAVTALAGCNRESTADGAGSGKVGIDLPRSDSDFWNSYQNYVEKGVKAGEVKALPLTNSQNDIGKLVANVQTFTDQGAKAVVMAPQDTGAIAESLNTLNEKKIPVVSVDTRPDKGNIYMVVRADNKAYGTNACKYLGEQLKGKGKVVEFQGDLASINGRDRSEAFKSCMDKEFPGIKVFELATDWKGDVASAKLQATLAANPDINGIYMQAKRCLPAAHPRAPGAEEAAEAGRRRRATSRSSPTTASRRSSTPSRPGRSTRRSPSPPTSTRSTRFTTRRRPWTVRPSRKAPPTTTRTSSRSRTASRTNFPRPW